MRYGMFACVAAGLAWLTGAAQGAAAEASNKTSETVVATLSWEQVSAEDGLLSGEPARDAAGSVWLKVTNALPGPAWFPLARIDGPAIQGQRYGLRGTIRYQDVAGVGYLEMWSHFADGGQYFSRTMAGAGPLQQITGSSAAREFLLPFDCMGRGPVPQRLEFNLALHGPGTVEISDIQVVDFGDSSLASVLAPGAWWDDRQAGLFGGLAGSLLGVCGGLLGMFLGMGRAGWLCRVVAALMLVAGVAAAIAGIVALINGQPYAVFYPLLLLGGLASIAGMIVLPLIGPIIRRHEMRRMQLMDAV
jgi:hypothetical protein